jgi:Catalase
VSLDCPAGPVLLQDAYLNEKLAHFVRERVPDRVYHVKGGGAFGYFEVTADVTQWTKAAFLNQVGKRTPMLAEFGKPRTDYTADEVGGLADVFRFTQAAGVSSALSSPLRNLMKTSWTQIQTMSAMTASASPGW